MMKNIAIIGATGAVGREIVSLLAKRNFPIKTLRLFSKTPGKTVRFQCEEIAVQNLNMHALQDCDLAFFCAGSAVSKEWIPKIKCLAIDSSSAFRTTVPLVIPEINAHVLQFHPRIIASPNCAATILLMPLFPLHRKYKVKRIVVSTYQAASGAGARLLEELKKETRAFLDHQPYPHLLAFPYAFNLYPHDSPMHISGYVEEERKMIFETQKILEDPQIKMSATCVRVPVLRAHSIAANVEFCHPFSIDSIYEIWEKTPGLKVFENRAQNRFPTPFDVTEKEEIYCGRLRIDPSMPNTIEFWAVGDQLLKGAALNAVQIAELTISNQMEQELQK